MTSRFGAESRVLQAVCYYGWLLCLILPFCFWGANRSWIWPLALCGSSLVLLLTLQTFEVRERLEQVGLGVERAWFWGLLAAWFALTLVQFLPLSRPEAGLVHDRSAVLAALGQNMHLLCMFLLTLFWANDAKRLRLALAILVSFAVAHSTLASAFALMKIRFVAESWGINAFGTSGFLGNKNLLAGFLELVLALGIGMLIADMRTNGSENNTETRAWIRDLVKLLLSRKAIVRLALIVLVIGLVMTQSRSGNAAFFIALTMVGLFALWKMRRRPARLGALLVSLIVIDVIVVGSWVGTDRMVDSVARSRVDFSAYREQPARTPDANQTLDPVRSSPKVTSAPDGAATVFTDVNSAITVERERPVLTRQTLAMWRQVQWMGVGPGGFRSNFPAFHALDQSPLFYDHAHNDYAQLLAERGIMGGIVLIGLVGSCFGAAVFALVRRRSAEASGLAFGCLVGMVSLGLHSFTDFNLRIPAIASFFAVVSALAWLSAYGLPDASPEQGSTRRSKSRRKNNAQSPTKA